MQLRSTSLFNSLCAVLAVIVMAGGNINSASGADASSDLQWSVHRLNAWMGGGEKAIGWRRYLLLNVLETQAAKGQQADIASLGQILNRFSSEVAGLEHPAFVEVRNALLRQVHELSNSFRGDVSQIAMSHLGHYRPISISDMQYERNRAKYDLQVLKRYYRSTLASRDRANLFYDLQLDEMVEFLDSVEFELAPEVSVGKISSMINDKRKSLRDVVREIDALPAEDEDDDIELEQPQPDDEGEEGPALAGPEDVAPGPDDDTPRDVLKRRKVTLEQAIKQLTASRKSVLEKDRPRLARRRAMLTEMRAFSARFEAVAKKRFDPYFASAALSFDQFIRRYAAGTSDNLQEDFLKRLQALAEDLPLLGDPAERRAAGRVGNHLEWLENAGQVASLVTAIRARFSQPNLYLNISSNLINSVAAQSIHETRVLDENISGRLIRGYATTSGNTSIELLDDPNQVHLNIHLLGQLASSSRFREGKMYGFVGANGHFEARRSLYANKGGLFAGQPYGAANVDTTFGGLTTRFQFIQRIARKQFEKGKAASDGDAARRAELEIYEKFSEQTNAAIGNGQDAIFNANSRAADYAAWLPEIFVRSSTEFVEAVGKKATLATLAAPDTPQGTTVPADVVLRLHDSMLSNFADPIFAGKTFTNEELATAAAELLGETPPGLASEDEEADDESFSITFDRVRPIQFEFDSNAFQVSISGRKFSQGDRVINAGLQIQLRFKIKRINGKLKFVRDGDAVLEYTDPDRKDAKIVAFKSFLEDKLNSEEASDTSNSQDLPNNLLPIDKMPNLKDNPIARNLQLVQCRAEAGWLYLGWLHAGQSVSYSASDLPAIWTEAVIDQFENDQLQDLLPPANEPIQIDGEVHGPDSAATPTSVLQSFDGTLEVVKLSAASHR